MTATLLGLSRTCDLTDFPGVITVAGWQQTLAETAWAQWTADEHLRTREPTVVDNWSGCAFVAPGPSAIYRYPGERGELAQTASAVFGLCVLDRHKEPLRYINEAGALLGKRGLLFLTFAFWNASGDDVAKGHQQRVRIYDAGSWKKLMRESRPLGFETFGAVDWAYHGHKLEDHTLASLVLTRR